MPLDVGGDVLEIVQRVCDRALNVATASGQFLENQRVSPSSLTHLHTQPTPILRTTVHTTQAILIYTTENTNY